MKTWIKRTLAAVLGTTLLAGSIAGCSHRGPGWSQMSAEEQARFKEKMVDRVAGKLDLDAAQKAKLGIVADKLREQRLALMPAGQDPRAQVQALVAGPSFDRNAAQVLLQQKTQAIEAKSPEVIAALADFYDSLNPTQQQKVRDFMNRGGHRWGRG